MTAKTSQKLADVLRAAKFEELAKRAELDEFHDFLSEHATPTLMLDNELVAIIKNRGLKERAHVAAHHIRMRLHDGEFDASREESDAWAESPDGRETFNRLVKGE